jgi:uncharacterized protein
MKFAEDHNAARYKITSYDSNSIGINGTPVSGSLILTPMELIKDWKPASFKELQAHHLDPFYTLDAEVILLGTGEKQIFPDTGVLRRLAQENIGFEIMDTQAACRTFNIIMAEGRTVVAGLFLHSR